MYPFAHVLYIEDGTFRFRLCEVSGALESKDPVDFGLKKTCEIIMVVFKMQAQACWLNGSRINL